MVQEKIRHKSKIDKVEHNHAFLRNPSGKRAIFVHQNDVEGKPNLKVGMLLEYELSTKDRYKAVKAKILTNETNTSSKDKKAKTSWLLEGKITEVPGNSGFLRTESSPEKIPIAQKSVESPYFASLKKDMIVEFGEQEKKKFWQVKPEPRLSPSYQSRFALPYKSRYSSQESKPKRYPPYHFVPVAKKPNVDEVDALLDTPVFHDGKNQNVYSGELCCTLTALTPLLVANDQYNINEVKGAKEHDKGVDLPDAWKIKSLKDKERQSIWVKPDKSVLEPLRLPDGRVLISGASLKGMLRQSISALLTAPMERVAQRTYSYRLNTKITGDSGKRYKCYPAIVEEVDEAGIPLKVKLLKTDLNKVKFLKPTSTTDYTQFSYMYGLDAQGTLLRTHEQEHLKPDQKPVSPKENVWIANNLLTHAISCDVSSEIKAQYKDTVEHLSDRRYGHLTGDHPLLPNKISPTTPKQLSDQIKNAGKMEPQQLIYVEAIEENGKYQITSLGHNFRYRWRYADTVRTRWSWNTQKNQPEPQPRSILQPSAPEIGERPEKLSANRVLFGYVQSDEETPGIGKDNFSRLAGRIAFNMAVEVTEEETAKNLPISEKPEPTTKQNKNEKGQTTKVKKKSSLPQTSLQNKPTSRFLNGDNGYTVALKELGAPRPSAVEFYLQQQGERPDRGSLITYGDVAGEDTGGELNGRKFYLHQPAAADLKNKTLYETNDDEVKASNQASLARFVSTPGTKFRFTLRFRDLRLWELGALLTTLEPEYLLNNITTLPNTDDLHQYASRFKNQKLEPEQKPEQYPLLAHKLGHGRPLGLGSVCLKIDHKLIATSSENISPESTTTADKIAEQAQNTFMKKLKERLEQNPQLAPVLKSWLGVHQFRGQVQSAYPEHYDEKSGESQIYEFHTALRQRHARNRQFEKPMNTPVRKETLVLPELGPYDEE